ncbi:MAG: ATP-binding protein [Oxalobacter sp.]|nr:ATP-binding protein [Oxalobacter sp.]
MNTDLSYEDELVRNIISISINPEIAQLAKKLFADATWVQNIPDYLLMRADAEITVAYNELDEAACEWLHQELLKRGKHSAAGTLAGLREASRNPANIQINSLMVAAQAIREYLRRDCIDGWIYAVGQNGEHTPWLVTEVSFLEASNAPPCVAVYLAANGIVTRKDDYLRASTQTFFFFSEDLQNKRVAELLGSKGFIKETEDLKEEYLLSMQKFADILPAKNEQFWAQGVGLEVNMEERSPYPERVPLDAPCRVINDEGLIQRRFFTKGTYPWWEKLGKSQCEIPIHPVILCFNLDTHTHMWMHVKNLTPYQYDASLRDKLILPEEHRDLIDILTLDMDILMDDIVAGKSGGTTILCMGAPGLGKTLTAEVYSEVVGRPLYRVHSGQLGVESDKVEKNLEKVLKRAQRWGAILLIDEADVYIRRRGNDIDHNAVVASFLRTLEYFHGLLFLTTNRVDDVDDAIISRCIATIRYTVPVPEDAKRIWRVLADQFQFALTDELIDKLVVRFDGISGRDIKELIKLTAKWCRQKKISPSIRVFNTCAQFRGL